MWNSSNTIKFIDNLQAQRPGIALIWDGAGYHKSDEVKEFWHQLMIIISLSSTLLIFAPNAPAQNPVEDVWLQAKNEKVLALCKLFGCQVAI